jgi:hypothetical protein
MAASERGEKVIQTIKNERRQFEVFCRALSDEELDREVPNSTWKVRDFIAHVGTLDTQLQSWFQSVVDGVPDSAIRNADGQPTGIDDWNDKTVAERRNWTLDEVFDEAAANREQLIPVIEQMTDEHLQTIVHFGGDNKRPPADIPFGLFLSGWAHHDAIHLADMLKALPDRKDDPELREWLSHPAVVWYQDAMSGPAREA